MSATVQPTARRVFLEQDDCAVLLAVFLFAALVAWATRDHPAHLPAWAPWEFSWSQFVGFALALAWYARGIALTPAAERPGRWRQASFLAGLGMIYAVLLTHFEYMAQHMFFLNRLQHAVMHHFGPFLVALSWPGAMLMRGMPAPLRRVFGSRPVHRAVRIVQNPVLAGVLFTGLIAIWLIPPVHFQAMLNPSLYDAMNWSMVIDGLLFWCLVLDPRPCPPARISIAARLAVTLLVMFPQIAMGAWITFGKTSLYTYYDLCGRLFPSLGALQDQHLGGVIVWIPSAMMSSVAFLLILNHLRMHEDRMPEVDLNDDVERITVHASSWTGR